MNKYEAAVPAHMRGLWSAICAAETDAERDGLMRQWDEACRRLSRRIIWAAALICTGLGAIAVAMWLLHTLH